MILENGKFGIYIVNDCIYFLIKSDLFVLYIWSLVEFYMNNIFNINE